MLIVKQPMKQQKTNLGLMGLTAIVVGGVIGGGIFNISKLLAEVASLGAIMISWIISSIGLLSIAMTFRTLNRVRPDLSQGIYLYSKTGFGNYTGFNIAWGYWMGTAIGNVVLSVMLNDAFGLFFPVLLEHGWPTFIFASCFSWFFTLVVSFGLKLATTVNTLSTILKFSALALIIILLFSFADYDMMRVDFWGKASHLGPLSRQVNSTLLTTLFFFIGIEGAIIVATRARRPSDIGNATILGTIICLILNIMVCILAFGFVSRQEMIQLDDPVIGQILGKSIGDWARIFVNISVIVSVAGAWLVSTIIAAELPAAAARDRILPHFFAWHNKNGSPVNALLINAGFIQLFLFITLLARNIYVLSADISGILILPTYILSALFLIKIGLKKNIYQERAISRQIAMLTGTITVVYCLWIIYAGNIHLLLLSSGVYVVGIFFYWFTHYKTIRSVKQLFTVGDRYVIALLIAATVFSILWEWKRLD